MLELFFRSIHQVVDPGLVEAPWEHLIRASNALTERDAARVAEAVVGLPPLTGADEQYALLMVRARWSVLDGKPADALVHFESARALAPDLGPEAMAFVRMRTGVVLKSERRLDEAVEELLAARTTFREYGREFDAALCDVELGLIQMIRGDVGAAAATLLGTLDVIDRDGLPSQQVAVRANIASALQRSGDLDGAERLYHELLNTEPFVQRKTERALMLQNLAVIHKLRGEYAASLQCYHEALECLTDTTQTPRIIRIQCGMADLQVRLGAWAEAQDTLHEIEQRQAGVTLTPSTRIELASLRHRLAVHDGDHEAAHQHLDEARAIAREYRLLEEHLETLQDALLVVTSDAERLPLLEELTQLQSERIVGFSTTIASMVDARARFEQAKAAQELMRQRERTEVILQTQERVLQEIGRDLHDSVGQDLVVVMKTSERLTPNTPAEHEIVEMLQSAAAKAATDARRISHVLSASDLTGETFTARVEELIHAAQTALPSATFTFSTRGSFASAPHTVVRMLYRALQSVMQNVLRHSQATRVDVYAGARTDEYVCTVEDNGVGFAPGAHGSGLGLRAIVARMELVDGVCIVDSTPGHGTMITLRVPRD